MIMSCVAIVVASVLAATSMITTAPRATAVTIYASDSFNRTASSGWGTADAGGTWTVAGTAANWSVSPGAGSIAAGAGGTERAYLGGVAVEDVELSAKVVLPRSSQNNNALAYLLGRDSGASGSFYRVGIGQGTAGTVILRSQRSDGASIAADLDTGIVAAEGAVVWVRVQFEGISPTKIRARAWPDGTTEPTGWLLDVTDSNAAQQIAGKVGVRVRNEDTVAPHTFRFSSFAATNLVAAPPPPPGPLASDSFNRSATAAWNSTDLGGFWTTMGTPVDWSVLPGGGSVGAQPNGDEWAYLSAVNARDIDVVTQIVLPRSSQANNVLAFVLARYVSAYNPTYYAIGVGQGTGANLVLRAQRSDGTSIGADLDTGIAALEGQAVWLHVQLQGATPTAIRARTWGDGGVEPASWLLDTTDTTAAEQVAGAVGVRARNEDTSAAHTVRFQSFQASGTSVTKPAVTPNPTDSTAHHYLYVFPDKSMDVFDIDNGHALVKHVALPTASVVGASVSPTTGMLYIEECVNICETSGGGRVLKYDLVTDTVVWVAYLPFGVDNGSLTPDGSRFYSPDGESSTDGLWHVLDGVTGAPTASIFAGVGGHNTIVSLDGDSAYLAGWQNGTNTRYLQIADTSTNTIVKKIGPLRSAVRPFTINGMETLAFTTASDFLGFEVSSITTGQVLYTMPIAGFTYTTFVTNAPSHGITLSPDEREVYVMDGPNAYVHVFDVTGLPGSAPVQVANIPLSSLAGNHSPCTSRCQREGWLLHSRDGRYVYVGDSGDVIDTATRTIATTLTSLRNTRHFLEVDWQSGAPTFTTTKSGLGYVGAQTPVPTATPTGTATPTSTSVAAATDTPAPTASPSPTFAASTATAAASATSQPSVTPTSSPSSTSTSTPPLAQTSTDTPTATATDTITPSATTTITPTAVATSTNTSAPSSTPTTTPSAVPTSTSSATSTSTPTAVVTATNTAKPSSTPRRSATPTRTPTTTATATRTSTPSITATSTPTAVATSTPTSSATRTMQPTETTTATATETSTSTTIASATSTPTASATATDTDTPTPSPEATETSTPTPTATVDPTADSDGDGCTDARELGADWHTGGERDPHDPWDFFDVPVPVLKPGSSTGTRDHVVGIGDVIAVMYYIGASTGSGTNGNGVSYSTDLDGDGVADGVEYDRTLPDATFGWQSGPPNGVVSIADALVALNQVGSDCR